MNIRRITVFALICIATLFLMVNYGLRQLSSNEPGTTSMHADTPTMREGAERAAEMAAEDDLVAKVTKNLTSRKENERVKDKFIFKERDNPSPQAKERLNAAFMTYNVEVQKTFLDGSVKLGYAKGLAITEEELCIELVKTGALAFAEPDYYMYPIVAPDDPSYSSQWYHTKMDSPGAWDITTGSNSIVVAVLDTGVDTDHPDLVANLQLPGHNVVDNSTYVEDTHGHGTYVAGCVGAVGNNGVGIAGIAWNVKILPVRIVDSSNNTTGTSMMDGVKYAADNGARCVNISWTGVAHSYWATSSSAYLRDRGGILFAGSGNSNYNDTNDGNYDDIIFVGATTGSDTRASFSNYGVNLDLVAPGKGIITTAKGGGYANKEGTSLSSPIAAGLGALIFSVNPSFTPADVQDILFSTCKDLGDPGKDIYYGHGRIQAKAAIDEAVLRSNNTLVRIEAITATLTEGAADTATLRFTRIGDASQPLTVNYTLSGTASSTDYSPALNGTVALPAGSASVDIVLTAADDSEEEPTEALVVDIIPGTGYIPANPSQASIGIIDNDNTAPVVMITAPTTVTLVDGGTRPWVPGDIPTAAWYDAGDASTITHSSGAVSQWLDKSGNNVHFTQSTGSAQPITGTRTLGGLNVLDFDGSNDYLRSSSKLADGLDYIIVFSGDGVIATQSLLGGPNTYVPIATGSTSSNILRIDNVNDPAGVSQLFGGEATQSITTRDDALTALSSSNLFVLQNAPSFTSSNYFDVGRGANTYWFNGCIAEIVAISSDTPNRQKVEGYLAHKWGFAANLPADHPYKSAAPTTNGTAAVATLNGTVIDGQSCTYEWSVVQPAPGYVTFGNAGAVDTSATFTVAGDYTIRLTATDEFGLPSYNEVTITVNPAGVGTPIADVDLPAGISLYGYTGENPIDAQAAFQTLIDNSQLSLVRWVNPADGQIKELYYTTFPSPGWINEIGDLTLGQGYVVKTTAACTLSIAGNKDTGSVSHDLPAGYSIIGFNKEIPQDTVAVFQSLIDSGKLDLVRWVNPSDGSIKELYYTTFPSAGWVNEIGDLTEGQGYIIKLNAPHTGLTLP